MNVLVVSVSDVRRSIGPGVATLGFVRALRRLGHQVTLVVPRPSRPDREPCKDLRVLYTPDVRRLRIPNNMNSLLQLWPVIGRIIFERYDLVYVRSNTLSFLIALAARTLSRARVCSEHNTWQAGERAVTGRFRWLCPIEVLAQVIDARCAHRVRCVLPGIAHRLRRYGVPSDKLFVVQNASDTHTVHPVPRPRALAELGLSADRRYAGFLGHFAAWQGLETVLEALPELCRRLPDVCLLLAGDGPLRPQFERRAAELQVSQSVRFLGEIAYSRVSVVLGCFDVALLPTACSFYVELGRSPLKLRDYAAAGRPVVAADIPAVRELAVGDSWVRLYRPGDASDLAHSAAVLLEDPTMCERLGRAARTYAEMHFSWDIVCEEIVTECLR